MTPAEQVVADAIKIVQDAYDAAKAGGQDLGPSPMDQVTALQAKIDAAKAALA